MEKYQITRDTARKNLEIADHMVYVTYKVVNDPKLLLAVMDNIFLALTNSMASVLHYERLYKRIPPFHDNFESKFHIFREKCVPKYKIEKKYLSLMRDVKDIIIEHKKSPVEFVKKDKFVICSEKYDIKTINIEQMKKFVTITKEFVANMNTIVSQNERLFN